MPQRYHLVLPDAAAARGSDRSLAFSANGAEEYAAQLQRALRTTSLFEAWRALQDDPDEVDAALGATDPNATVSGSQRDLRIELVVITSISGSVLRHRMKLLAGSGWTLNDVSAA
jgi:hypothetical protein